MGGKLPPKETEVNIMKRETIVKNMIENHQRWLNKEDGNVLDGKTEYRKGEIVYADEFDSNRWNECSHGIHFFVDRKRAVNYDI